MVGHRASSGRLGWGLVLGTAALEALVVGLWAAHRGVNADEGFYLTAARYVAQGRHLYRDVFFPQMPYVPWTIAFFFRFFEPSLAVGRGVSVGAAAISAGLLAGLVWKQEERVLPTVVIGLLYVFSAVLVNSLAVLKTSALVNACLLASFAPLVLGWARRPAWAFASGMAAGCAIGFRLPVVPVALLFAVLAWRLGFRALVAYGCGGLVASLPWLLAAVQSPDGFWFCNVTFHALRREITGWPAVLSQKAGIVAKWLFLPQHVLVWALAAYGVWLAPRRVWPAAVAALVLAAAYAAATPTYLEYMTQFLPFLLLAAVPAVVALGRRRWVLAALVAAYLVGFYPLVKPVPAGSRLADKRALWDLETVEGVSAAVRRHCAANETVLSWWEGYPLLSGRPGVVGVGFWESNIAKKLDPERARRYHVVRREELERLIRERVPAVIVVADGTWSKLRPAIEAGYRSVERVDGVEIYGREPSDPDRA